MSMTVKFLMRWGRDGSAAAAADSDGDDGGADDDEYLRLFLPGTASIIDTNYATWQLGIHQVSFAIFTTENLLK